MSRAAVSQNAPPAGRTLGGSAKLALAGLGLTLGLVLAEVCARLLGLGPQVDVMFHEDYRLSRDPVLRYELVPGARDGDAHISSVGLRDREYAPAKAAGVFRVAVVGDSIAYGFGLPQSDALAKQLEEVLRDDHSPGVSRFEVLNFGVSGYDIDQVVETVRARVASFQPDLIVYAYCLNDPEPYSFEYEVLRAQRAGDEHSPLAALGTAGRHWLARSRLFLWLRSAFQPRPPTDQQWAAVASGTYVDYFEQLYRGAGEQRLARGVDALGRVARERSVPVVALVFPLFLDLGHYPFAALHARVLSQFGAAGMRAYDLAPLYRTMFRQHGPVFVLNALHPNALGQRLAALFAAHALSDDGLLPAPAQPWVATGELRQLDQLLEPVIATARAAGR